MFRRRCEAVIDEDYVQEHILTAVMSRRWKPLCLLTAEELFPSHAGYRLALIAAYLSNRGRCMDLSVAIQTSDLEFSMKRQRRAKCPSVH
jgi:hypothetical protein